MMEITQGIFTEIPTEIQPCLDSVVKVYPQRKLIKMPYSDNPIIDSDNWRFDMWCEADDILYIDWDITILSALELVNNGRPCASFYKGQPDYCLIYSPHKEFWIDLDNERKRRGISRQTYGWIRKLLRDKNVNEIKGGFEHLRYTKTLKQRS